MRRAARVVAGLVLAVLPGLVLGGCGADRPEGTTERFAETLDRGVDTALLERLGSAQAAEGMLGAPFTPSERNQENFDSIEVAPGEDAGSDSDAALVPILVVRASDPDTPARLQAEVTRRDGAWYVSDVTPLSLPVDFPSEGGPGIVDKSTLVIATSVGVFVVSLAISFLVIRLFGGRVPDEVPAGRERRRSRRQRSAR